MSTCQEIYGILMSTFCERLKEERNRIGLNQTELGEFGGVKKQAQLKYEKGERFPDSNYLEKIAKAGVDVSYVVTGVSSQQDLAPSLAPDEQMLLDSYRSMSMSKRKAVLASMLIGDAPEAEVSKPKAKEPETKTNSGSLSVTGKNSNVRIAGRDYNER